MKNISVEVTGKGDKAELVIKVKLGERHGLSNSGNTITIASTQGNQKIGHGDVAFGLSVYTKEGLAAAQLAAAKEAGHANWADYQKAVKESKAA